MKTLDTEPEIEDEIHEAFKVFAKNGESIDADSLMKVLNDILKLKTDYSLDNEEMHDEIDE